MKRLLLTLLLLPVLAQAQHTVISSERPDGTVNTGDRAGAGAGGGTPPTGFTVIELGDVTTSDVDDNTGTVTVTVRSGGDELGFVFAYKEAATDQDLHVEFELQSSITGDQSPFNGCGAAVIETGTDISDYKSYTFYPIANTTRLKTDAGGAGESTQFSSGSESLPEFLLIQYDDSETDIQGAQGTDGSTWTQVGSDVSKSLTFPVRYGFICFTDDDATGSATFTITDLVADGTIETLGGGGGGGPPATVFSEDFSSTTWYQTAGWGAGANGAGPSGDPRTASGGNGTTFSRVTGTNNGVAERDGAYGEVLIKSGQRVGTNASIYFSELGVGEPTNGDSAWVRYYMAFGTTYDGQQNGKGPGFSATSSTCGSGGAPCDGTDGWSARSKTAEPCANTNTVGMDSYVYHADMPGTFGATFDWADSGCGESGVFVQGTWYCVEQQITMNSVGASQNDGILRAWVDGTQVMNKTTMQLDNAGNHPVQRVWWNVYHGGGTTAPQNMHVYFDDIAISTTAQIGCL